MSDEQSPLSELDTLEYKITQVVALCRQLRTENNELREKLAVAEGARQELAGRMNAARERIARLAQQLPETKD